MPSRWIRWEPTTHIYEYSTDFAASWNPLPLNAAILTEGVIDAARFPPTIPKLDLGNIWTGVNTLSGVAPALRWNETDAPTDSKNWEIQVDGQIFRIRSANDALNAFTDLFYINRSNGSIVVNQTAPGTNNFNCAAAGSIGLSVRNTNPGNTTYAQLVAGTDASPFAAAIQAFSSGYTGSPEPDFANGVSLKVSQAGGLSIVAQHASGGIRFYTGGSASKRLEITAAGEAKFSSLIYERGRSLAMGQWATWSCVWASSGTQPTLGNATLSARYTRYGQSVHIELYFSFGSSSAAGTGSYSFSLPHAIAGFPVLTGRYIRAGGTYSSCFAVTATATTIIVIAHGSASQFGATVPFAWANSDGFIIAGTYSTTDA